MALRKILILRCLAERGLEGRTVLIQPIVDFLTASKGRDLSCRRYYVPGKLS
jgi:hypothetical protein